MNSRAPSRLVSERAYAAAGRRLASALGVGVGRSRIPVSNAWWAPGLDVIAATLQPGGRYTPYPNMFRFRYCIVRC